MWQQYSIYQLIDAGMKPERAEALVKIDGPALVLPASAGLAAADGRALRSACGRQLAPDAPGNRGAAFVGVVAYSLVFILNQDPGSLPRIVVGAFIVLAALLTLIWRDVLRAALHLFRPFAARTDRGRRKSRADPGAGIQRAPNRSHSAWSDSLTTTIGNCASASRASR